MSKELENMLIAKQVKPTPIRLLVLEYLLKQTAAVTIADLEKAFPQSDKVTLYRTLKTFEEQGIVHDINADAEATKYALCEEACKPGEHLDLHVHFYCTSCKELMCLPKTQLPQVALPENFQLQELSLVARGICDNCSMNASELHGAKR